MELDWTTFALEVINFLVLVWLLKHFLYRPVLTAIAERRNKIETELAQASSQRQQAQALQAQYEQRLDNWEAERRQALAELDQQIIQERAKRLQQLDADLELQRQRQQAREQQQQQQWAHQAEAEALQLGTNFVSRLLQTLSGPELDQKLRERFIDQLVTLQGSELDELQQAWQQSPAIEIISAYELDTLARQALTQALEQRLGHPADYRYQHNPQLLAGLRILFGGHILGANLLDELRFFREAANG